MQKSLLKALGVASVLAVATQAVAVTVDPAVPTYQKQAGVSGNISSVGSDTLANMMTFWAEEFKRTYPNVNIQIQAAGSSTAPPALTEGTSNMGPMSRKMKTKEEAMFEKHFGYKPTPIAVAIDALAVYVNKNNPIEGLTIPQVDAIFSSTNKCGYKGSIDKWDQVGVLKGQAIQLFGRNSVSGTYGYFKKKALCKGDAKAGVNEQPGSASVIQSIATSINGIGYSGMGYKTSDVRFVPLTKKAGGKFVMPTPESAVDGSYPLSRLLYVYVNKKPGQAVDPLTKEFLTLVLSQSGQKVVVKSGFIPLPAALVKKELAKLD